MYYFIFCQTAIYLSSGFAPSFMGESQPFPWMTLNWDWFQLQRWSCDLTLSLFLPVSGTGLDLGPWSQGHLLQMWVERNSLLLVLNLRAHKSGSVYQVESANKANLGENRDDRASGCWWHPWTPWMQAPGEPIQTLYFSVTRTKKFPLSLSGCEVCLCPLQPKEINQICYLWQRIIEW